MMWEGIHEIEGERHRRLFVVQGERAIEEDTGVESV